MEHETRCKAITRFMTQAYEHIERGNLDEAEECRLAARRAAVELQLVLVDRILRGIKRGDNVDWLENLWQMTKQMYDNAEEMQLTVTSALEARVQLHHLLASDCLQA